MHRLFIWLQHCLPQHLLSRSTGWLAERRRPRWLVRRCIALFVRRYRVDLTEAEAAPVGGWPTFNAFFTRPLRAGVRPVAAAELVSPVDGSVSQCGYLAGDRILQAKGRAFTTSALLGGDRERAAAFRDGQFVTLYLAPRDYHRVHMPCAGRLQAASYVPGRLFSVNAASAAAVDRLFARNERCVFFFAGEHGPFAMVLVGAMIVAGIETVFSGRITPPRRPRLLPLPVPAGDAGALGRGEELGRFCLGSTVIVLFPPGRLALDPACVPGATVRVGDALARSAPRPADSDGG